jgi:hypothetical protein
MLVSEMHYLVKDTEAHRAAICWWQDKVLVELVNFHVFEMLHRGLDTVAER